MKRHCACDGVRGHIQNFVEGSACFVPLAGVMTIKLTEVTKWSRIGWIHLACFPVESLGSHVSLSYFSTQAAAHHGFDTRALNPIKNGSCRNATDFADA